MQILITHDRKVLGLHFPHENSITHTRQWRYPTDCLVMVMTEEINIYIFSTLYWDCDYYHPETSSFWTDTRPALWTDTRLFVPDNKPESDQQIIRPNLDEASHWFIFTAYRLFIDLFQLRNMFPGIVRHFWRENDK